MTEPASPAEPPTDPPAPATPAKPNNTTIWAVVVGIAVAITCGIFAATSHSSDNGGALVACEGFVKDRLKSPGSADFSSEDLTGQGDTYELTGSVDSDNSFGASVRNDFDCTVHNDGGQWTLVSLTGLYN